MKPRQNYHSIPTEWLLRAKDKPLICYFDDIGMVEIRRLSETPQEFHKYELNRKGY